MFVSFRQICCVRMTELCAFQPVVKGHSLNAAETGAEVHESTEKAADFF